MVSRYACDKRRHPTSTVHCVPDSAPPSKRISVLDADTLRECVAALEHRYEKYMELVARRRGRSLPPEATIVFVGEIGDTMRDVLAHLCGLDARVADGGGGADELAVVRATAVSMIESASAFFGDPRVELVKPLSMLAMLSRLYAEVGALSGECARRVRELYRALVQNPEVRDRFVMSCEERRDRLRMLNLVHPVPVPEPPPVPKKSLVAEFFVNGTFVSITRTETAASEADFERATLAAAKRRLPRLRSGASALVDDDISFDGSQEAAIVCPIGLSNIRIPARFVQCKHRACFDLQNFMDMKKQQRQDMPTPAVVWRCPICKVVVTGIAQLGVDTLFERALEDVYAQYRFDNGDGDSDDDTTPTEQSDRPLWDDADCIAFGDGTRTWSVMRHSTSPTTTHDSVEVHAV